MKNLFNSGFASQIRKFPQNAIINGTDVNVLHQMGGSQIDLRDEAMNPLFIRKDTLVPIKFKILNNSGDVVPDEIEMRRYDLGKDEWEILGEAEREGEFWYGSIDQFGQLIWGMPHPCRPAVIKTRYGEWASCSE